MARWCRRYIVGTVVCVLLSCTLCHELKVELHSHIDGSLAPQTLWDIAQMRGMHDRFPPDVKRPEDLRKYISVVSGGGLHQFFATFDFFLPFITDSAAAVEMMATAFVREQAANGVLYSEGRFAPQLLAGPNVSVDDVVAAARNGIDIGVNKSHEQIPGLRVNLILCCVRGLNPQRCYEVVELAKKHSLSSSPEASEYVRASAVVGIDFAEGGGRSTASFAAWIPPLRYANAQGVPATVHAGEECTPPDDCPTNCKIAWKEMFALRIGHGYHCGDTVWEELNNSSIHIEACPSSSIGTGAVKSWAHHPIGKYADRGYSFGINTDDEGVLNTNMTMEMMRAVSKIGLTEVQARSAVLSAAKAAFLPPEEVTQLRERLSAQTVAEVFM